MSHRHLLSANCLLSPSSVLAGCGRENWQLPWDRRFCLTMSTRLCGREWRNVFAVPSSGSGTSQVALVVKNPPANAGDTGDLSSIPGLGRSPRGGYGNPVQYSCLENPMDRGAWWVKVHRITKHRTQRK